MKIYTKSGDQGKTSLVSGRRVDKSELLLEAYGTVDELNAHVGVLIALVESDELITDLHKIQNILFNMGSVLAQDGYEMDGYPEVTEDHVLWLETEIDRCTAELPELRQFILPSGSLSISQAHVCRTVCRRAERRVAAVMADTSSSFSVVLQLLNRLSDYFFVLARYIGHQADISEVVWDAKV